MRIAVNQKLSSLVERESYRVALLSDHRVAALYGENVAGQLGAQLFTFPAGERSKTRATKEQLEDELLAAGFGRDTLIVALGGGVVTDLAGFIAATFCRGVPLILIPTTLLAMSDAAIGGKTAVNTSLGKNLIGVNYQPKELIIDPFFLLTLPREELQNGAVEMIKHGLIADRGHFEWLVQHAHEILSADISSILEALQVSCAIKEAITSKDLKEGGLRRICNFGHTVGHAIEQVMGYQISHGKAVAMGMVVEGWMSCQLSMLEDVAPIVAALQAFDIDWRVPTHLACSDLWQAICQDKKAKLGVPRVTLLRSIGEADPCEGDYCKTITQELFDEAWKWTARSAPVLLDPRLTIA